VLLAGGAAVALAWANSPWSASYERLWESRIGLSVAGHILELDLRGWVNEGLMTIFFFVVGLEIRREIHAGELSEIRRAALPLAAALGGMIVPALLFASLNRGRASSVGWAIPMATDIAFAVGVLALLGRRVAPALRIFLLALAVIDDVGAILVIAFFYSSELAALGFAVLGLGILVTFILRRIGVQSSLLYIAPGILVWAGAYMGGINPTLAGVVMGLMTPAEPSRETGRLAARREAVSPVERLQHLLHGWVAYGIMPLFAFANAGVSIRQVSFAEDAFWVFLGVTLGLAIGKPMGILAASWLSVRSGGAAMPRGIRWPAVGVVGMVGGIGFTMALFVAQLAFPNGPLLEISKLAVLCGSGLAGMLSLFAGYLFLKPGSGRAAGLTEAERSTLE
jgi:NhaA family Na+:H+ antiporter